MTATVGERTSGRGAVAARYGFRAVEHVYLVTTNGATLATVTGVCHRYPRTVRVPLRVAAELVAAGVPLTIDGSAGRPAEQRARDALHDYRTAG